MADMKAAVIYKPGGPEVLQIEHRPIRTPSAGQVLLRVMAFGLNRSEMFTRQGYSPNVKFPRILGIEAVGVVEDAPGSNFSKGDVVATVMGGMGGSLTEVMRNTAVFPLGKSRKSGRIYLGRRSVQFRRCCRSHGDLCSRRSVS
jgi:NADPH:quinone reductase-like Zn-dependent oxidoreductase